MKLGYVSVWQRQDKYYLEPFDRCVSWVWISSQLADAIVELPSNVSDEELGAALKERLELCRDGESGDDEEKPYALLQMAGVRSERAMAKGARVCHVDREDELLTIIPQHNDGTGGFEPVQPDTSLKMSIEASNEEIGREVRAALGRTTSR